MKRPYESPRVITLKVQFGVFGNYGTTNEISNEMHDSRRFDGS
jgi:hypothetical protein